MSEDNQSGHDAHDSISLDSEKRTDALEMRRRSRDSIDDRCSNGWECSYKQWLGRECSGHGERDVK
jgi:hypothetical protein